MKLAGVLAGSSDANPHVRDVDPPSVGCSTYEDGMSAIGAKISTGGSCYEQASPRRRALHRPSRAQSCLRELCAFSGPRPPLVRAASVMLTSSGHGTPAACARPRTCAIRALAVSALR